MALNPLDILKDVVTPYLTDPADHQADSKAALLGQYYPILLALFNKFPDRLNDILRTGQGSLSQLAGVQPGALQGLLEAFSRHHNIPTSGVESLINSAVVPSAKAIQDAVGSGSIASYLQQYMPVISSNIPAWASGLLTTLGLGGLISQVSSTKKPTGAAYAAAPAEAGGFFKKILPWIALLILLLLLLFFWRSCVGPKVPANTGANGNPASLSFSSGTDGSLNNCQATVGNEALGSSIAHAVSTVFGADKGCPSSVDPATSTTLPGQEKLADILSLIKSVPGASVEWVGNKLSISGVNPEETQKLVSQIKALAPELDVAATGAAVTDTVANTASSAVAATASAADNAANAVTGTAEDIAKSVGNSIDSAKSALGSLSTQSNAADVAKALNLQIINFATGSNNIPPKNKEVLDEAAAVIKKLPNASFSVNGYTDSKGNADSNKALSERRAKAVVDYLVSKGVDASKLTAVGHGADNPVADNNTEDGRFKNRRIEFEAK